MTPFTRASAPGRPSANATGLRAFVHVAHGLDAGEYRRRSERGEVPDASPYGFHHAEERGVEVLFSRDSREGALGRFHRRAWMKLFGFDVVHAWRNRKKMLAADVIWTMEERQYLAALFVQRILRPHAPPNVIAQTVWLFNSWPGLGATRRWLYRALLSRAAALTVHSVEYLEPGLADFGRVPPELLYFGISRDTFPQPRPPQAGHMPIRIFAAGNDPTRDWATFLEAFGNDPCFEMRAAGNALARLQPGDYRNLQLLSRPSMEEFRAAYLWADYVLVPMVPNRYSGITVALEAVAMGAAVVSSRTGGVPTYFSEEEVLYVTPADASTLRQAVLNDTEEARHRRLLAAQRRFAQEDYSSRGMAHRYVELSLRLLAERAVPEVISRTHLTRHPA